MLPIEPIHFSLNSISPYTRLPPRTSMTTCPAADSRYYRRTARVTEGERTRQISALSRQAGANRAPDAIPVHNRL